MFRVCDRRSESRRLNTDIHTIRLGFCNTYLVRGEDGYVLVDAGSRRQEGRFFRRLASLGIPPQQIRLIVVTHVHFDHVGSLAAIRKACGCPVAVHETEHSLLSRGKVVIPPGTNSVTRFLSRQGSRRNLPFFGFEAVQAEAAVNREMDLAEFGLKARLIHTPGHTSGSLTLALDDGRFFVGDAAVNYLPLGMGPILPPFAEKIDLLFRSWAGILALGGKIFYPAHGSSFCAARLRAELRKRSPA